jgi:hypothetical protein
MQRYTEQIAYRDEVGRKKLIKKLAKAEGLNSSEFIRGAVNREIARLAKRAR